MKNLSLTLIIAFSTVTSFAAIEDFNQLINDAEKAQKAVHQEIKATVVQEAKLNAPKARQHKPEAIVGTVETVHINTDKNLLRFAKEKKIFKASDKKNDNRIAEEFLELE